MSTFFGIEDTKAQALYNKNMVCLPRTPDGKLDMHNVVSPIKREDIIFLKHCTTQSVLKIKAIGVVKSDYPAGEQSGICMPVEWVWHGEKTLEHFDELLAVRSDMIYEEHDIVVQKEVSALLPGKYQLQQEW